MNVKAGRRFEWSPKDRTLSFNLDRIGSVIGKLQFLHEVSHALLGHSEDSLENEKDAWDLARQLAERLQLPIDHLYIARRIKDYE